MPEDVRIYRVFIASPSGLEAERRRFREVLSEWNELFCLDRRVGFYPIGWEDTLPGVGRPQTLINAGVRKSDFLVLVLWDRWGTPPGGNGPFTSGTEEEFDLAKRCLSNGSMRQIVVLFKGVPPRQLSDPGDQLNRVQEFKKQLEQDKSFLYGTFDVIDEFSKHINRQLLLRAVNS